MFWILQALRRATEINEILMYLGWNYIELDWNYIKLGWIGLDWN